MILNVTDVLLTEGKAVETEVPMEMEFLEYGRMKYPVRAREPVSVTVKNMGKGRALITGHAKVVAGLSCDRCLKEVSCSFSPEFEVFLFSPEAGEDLEEEEREEGLVGNQINVDRLIANELIVNWPVKVLCRPDCRGICIRCGKDLNEGDCGCDTFVPDPRMARIMDIFNAGKEV